MEMQVRAAAKTPRQSEKIHRVIDQNAAQDAVGFFENVLQGLFYVLFGVRKGDDADGRALPDVVEVQFGDGDVEFAAQAVFQAAEDLALVLQGASVGNVQFEG